MEAIVAIIIALLGILFGYRLKVVLADRAKQDDVTAKMGLAYHEGFDDGYFAAETEEDDDTDEALWPFVNKAAYEATEKFNADKAENN
jgi:hypothetical protein